MVEVASADDPDLAHLQVVAEVRASRCWFAYWEGDEMTQVLLCAGPGLLVVKRDGLLFFRRPGQPDAPVPYATEHYPVFLNWHRACLMTPRCRPSVETAWLQGKKCIGLNRLRRGWRKGERPAREPRT